MLQWNWDFVGWELCDLQVSSEGWTKIGLVGQGLFDSRDPTGQNESLNRIWVRPYKSEKPFGEENETNFWNPKLLDSDGFSGHWNSLDIIGLTLNDVLAALMALEATSAWTDSTMVRCHGSPTKTDIRYGLVVYNKRGRLRTIFFMSEWTQKKNFWICLSTWVSQFHNFAK